MVKTPRTRHSGGGREPVTIELGPDEVSRVPAEGEAAEAKADIGESVVTEPVEATSPDATVEISEEGKHPDAFAEPVAETVVETPAEPAPEPTSQPAFGGKQDSSSTSDNAFGRRADGPDNRTSSNPPPRASRGSTLGAGIAGGVAALAIGAVLHYAGLIGAPGSAVPASFEAELAGLKSEVEVLKSAAGAPADLSGVTGQIDTLSQGLEQVRGEISSLQQAIQSGGAGDGAGLEALNTKITEIESRIANLSPGTDGAGSQELAALGERIAAVEALAKSATDAGSTIEGRLGALEQSVAALGTKVDAQAGQPKIALAIAASALKAAIERGTPFQPEVETFAAIAPDAPGLAELRTYAENGLATRADLVAETGAAAQAMIAAANPPPANAGFFERLLSSAESLVSVRPIGAVEGPGAPETVARMEVALQAGDLAKAVAEYDTLPEAAKAAGASFADKIRARLAAEQLADQAIAAAMQAA